MPTKSFDLLRAVLDELPDADARKAAALTEVDELVRAAVEARLHGKYHHTAAERRRAETEATAAVTDDDDYQAVWGRWWAGVIEDSRHDVDYDGAARYRPEPAVAQAMELLGQIVDLEIRQFIDPIRYVQQVDALAARAAYALSRAINFDQVQRELADYASLLDTVSDVYMHITHGRISKPFTLPSEVWSVADEITEERVAAVRKAAEPFDEERALLEEAGDAPVAIDGRLLTQLLDAIGAL